VVLLPTRFVGHKVRSCASRARNVNTLFIMLVRAPCGSHKKCWHTLCRTSVFASGGICGLGSASGERNVDALFFKLG
jgi:hypothetical protein